MKKVMQVGTVGQIRRYPVKSMLGELLRCVEVETRGLRGDRICAYIDQDTGKVASAKLPHRWKRLLECRAAIVDDKITIVFPDGSMLAPEKAEGKLSEMLGRTVTVLFDRPDGLELDRADPDLVCEHGNSVAVDHSIIPVGMGAPDGGFFDAMPIHFLTSASLAAVSDCPSEGMGEAARFRPNIVINTLDHAPFGENGWVGRSLRIGDTLQLDVLFSTPRCAVPTLRHGDIEPNPQIVRNIGEMNKAPVLDIGEKPCLGAYARVVSPGPMRVGDTVFIELSPPT